VSPAATSRGDALARWIATTGGLGYAPFAPGSVTSLPVALLVWAWAPPRSWLLGVTAVVTAVGIWAAGREEARAAEHDPSSIVVDEVAGMLVAMLAAPPGLGWTLLFFVLFRVMDVWKPFPIHRLQDLPGGWGIVVDDLLAGVYAGLLGWLAHLLWLRA
jgi:phosphatidylglycerophosphatase A